MEIDYKFDFQMAGMFKIRRRNVNKQKTCSNFYREQKLLKNAKLLIGIIVKLREIIPWCLGLSRRAMTPVVELWMAREIFWQTQFILR